MLWLLLVGALAPLPAENVGQDNPDVNSTMLLDFRDAVVTVGGTYLSEAECQAHEAPINAARRAMAFCVEAR